MHHYPFPESPQAHPSQEGLKAVLMPAEDTWEWSGDNLRAAMREAALYWPARWGL